MSTAGARAANLTTAGSPILKWVGGKTRLLPKILAHYDGRARVVEPFFGGGAVTFALAAQHPGLEVVANDFIAPVIGIYEAVRDDVEAFITAVQELADPYLQLPKEGRRAFYYDLRDRYMRQVVDGPAPLFFMLWCAYSGMYRTGKTYPGRFNTPFGFGQEKPGFYRPDRLRATAALMRDWAFSAGDFAGTLDHVTADTFVFLDPPYRGTYDGYTGAGFTDEDHRRVVDYFNAAADRGAKVVYTNKCLGDGFYEEHFAGRRIERVPIRYQVNRDCGTNGRPQTFEVLITT